MGMDVYGKNPITKTGEYFRASIWEWRPLWSLVIEICKDFITVEQATQGNYNSGYFIPPDTAKQISERLKTFVSDKEHNEDVRKDQESKFYTVTESGSILDYPLPWENIERFIEFIDNSDGFNIW